MAAPSALSARPAPLAGDDFSSDPAGTFLRAWERKIGDPWCTQLFFGSGLTIPTSDGTYITPWRGDNYSSATIENFDEIDAQVEKLRASHKIELVSDPHDIANLVVNPVGAANKKDRGVILPEKRFYLDCSRHINSRLPHYEMRLPGYDEALDRLSPGAWMAKVDLSAAFLHVRVDKRYRRLLGFSWRGKFYRFTHMIFGLSTAPAIWQYAMERVRDYLRSLGLNVSVYLDDFLLISDTEEECHTQLRTILDELTSLGLTVNHKKTLGPAQAIHYLGLEIDSALMEIRVPDYKLQQVRKQIEDFRRQHFPSNSAPLRAVLSLTGRLGHIARAVRASRPFLRRLWNVCQGLDFAHHLRHRSIHLTPAVWRDLEWWESLLSRWNGVARWIRGADLVSFSDASNLGFGFHCGPNMRAGAWPSAVRGRHINWKELRAIELSCAEFGSSWAGRRVLFACDNLTAVHIINAGSSRNDALASCLRRIAMLASLYDFDFRAVHIPGSANVLADALSRSILAPSSDAWPTLYLDLLDASPTSLLSNLDSLRSRIATVSNAMLSASRPTERHRPSSGQEHAQLLFVLREAVPDLERLATSLGGHDLFGCHRPTLPRVSSPPRLRPETQPLIGSCSELRPHQPLRRQSVEGPPPAREGDEGHHTHCRRADGTEAPIPLKVVTPLHPPCP